MILRDVIYSDQPRMLKHADVEVVTVKIEPPVMVTNTAIPEISNIVPVCERFSLERVLEWLNSQDHAVRLRLVRNLDDEMEQVRSEAIIEGRIAGTNAAKSEFNTQYANALEVLRVMAEKYEILIVQEREAFARACADIVGTALVRLVGDVLVMPDACVAAVKHAAEHVRGAREVIIRVNERDMEMITARKSDISEILGSNELSIVADQRVSTGGCLLESSFGEIDARWETQLTALINLLRGNQVTGVQS